MLPKRFMELFSEVFQSEDETTALLSYEEKSKIIDKALFIFNRIGEVSSDKQIRKEFYALKELSR